MNRSMTNISCERNQFMKTETPVVQTGSLRDARQSSYPAPSLRVPVTADNRAFLRWLRAAELTAWEAGLACKQIRGPAPVAAAPNLYHSLPNSTYQNT